MTGDGRPGADGHAHDGLAGLARLGELREALLATEVPVPPPPYEQRLRATVARLARRAASFVSRAGRRARTQAPTAMRLAGKGAALSVKAIAWWARTVRVGTVALGRAVRAARVGSKARTAVAIAARVAMLVIGTLVTALTSAMLWLARRIRAAGVRSRPRRSPRASIRREGSEPSSPAPAPDAELQRARRALELAVAAHGTFHAETASALHVVAAMHHDAGRYADAGPLYEDVVAIREATLGPAHPLLAQTLDDLAALRRESGDDAAASALAERARAMRAGSPDVAGSGASVSATAA